MMKRKFIAGAVAVSIMMMGAGYAAWTQNFTVTNTVNTGQLAFNAELVKPEPPKYATITFTDEKASPSEGIMALKFDKVYPDSTFMYSVTVTDASTVGVKYVLSASNIDPKYCEQMYQIEGLTEFVSLKQLNETLAVMYNQENLKKAFNINVRTNFLKTATESELPENNPITQTLTLNGSQFNAN